MLQWHVERYRMKDETVETYDGYILSEEEVAAQTVKRQPFQGYYDSILPPEEPTQEEIDEAVYHWDGMKRMRDDE